MRPSQQEYDMHRCRRKAVIARQRNFEREQRNKDDQETIDAILAALAEWQQEIKQARRRRT